MMPRLSGMSLAQKLKSDPRLKSVPLMFVTGSGSSSDTVDGINVGARFLIRKPFKLRDLLEKVGSVVGK
jgi:two-component system phosphate regulon response regulator PhoB